MNQSPYIAKSIKTLWNANTTLPGLCPGGLLYGLEKQGTTRPFATLKIELDGEPDYMTGLIYGQNYRLVVTVFSDDAIGNSGTIQTALETLMTATTKLASLTNGAVTLHISLEPGSLREDETRYRGKFTFIAGAAWQLQLQETRS